MFRLISFLTLFLMISGCATSSAPTKMKYLVGSADSKMKSEKIYKALLRRTPIKKKIKPVKGAKSNLYTGADGEKYSLRSIGTKVSFIPMTEPLLTVMKNEKYNKEAFQKKWSDEEKQQTIKASLSKAIQNQIKSKQCFETVIYTKDYTPIGGVLPEELAIKYWYFELEQFGKKQKITVSEKPQCLVKTTKTAYGNKFYSSVSTKGEYSCFTTSCSESPIDITKPFKVIVDARYKEGLHPVTMEWEGAK